MIKTMQRLIREASDTVSRNSVGNRFDTRMKIIANPKPRIKYSFLPTRAEGATISHPTDAE